MFPHQPSSIHSYTEKHVIETPEQMRLEFALAGIGSRFLALAIDTLIQIGVALVILILAAIIGFSGELLNWSQGRIWGIALLVAIFFMLYFGYFALFEILWGGQTPGKRAIGIRVIKETGRPLSVAEVIGRNLLRIVDQLPGFYGVGVLAAMLNFQNKRVGDFVVGSIVVREQSLEKMRPVLQVAQSGTPESRLGAERLTPEEVALIDAFLNRRDELAHDVRSRMADEILRRVEGKLSLTPAQRFSTEKTLESLMYERRSGAAY